MSMKNKLIEKINDFKRMNKQTSGGVNQEEQLDIPADVMIECDGLVKIYKTKDIEVLALQGLDLTVERGELTPEMARNYPGKNYITRAIGTEPTVECDLFRLELEKGEADIEGSIDSLVYTEHGPLQKKGSALARLFR